MEETTTERAKWILQETATERAKWILQETATERAKWILHDISYRGINFNPSNWREEG